MGSDKAIHIYKNATAIITGRASGIGRALAEGLAKQGCEVVLADCQIDLNTIRRIIRYSKAFWMNKIPESS